MKSKTVLALTFVGIICAVILILFRFEYTQLSINGDTFPVRVNRLTGTTCVFYGDEWSSSSNPRQAGLKDKDRMDVIGWGTLDPSTERFEAKVYNGSASRLTSVILKVDAFRLSDVNEAKNAWDKYLKSEPAVIEQNGANSAKRNSTPKHDLKWSRKFRENIDIDPMSMGVVSISVGSCANVSDFEWYFEEINGYEE